MIDFDQWYIENKGKVIDPRNPYIIDHDINELLAEKNKGTERADTTNIREMDEHFRWKRSFVNCWTGIPNAGKSTFLMYMALVKSLVDDWKWCLWTPEMLDGKRSGNKVQITANSVINELIFMKTGRSVYKHYDVYHLPLISDEEYVDAYDWVIKHFFIVDLKNPDFNTVKTSFMNIWEDEHYDGMIIDPWKNIVLPGLKRSDLELAELFADIKMMALKTNTTVNIVAHPKSQSDMRSKDGGYRMATQFDLSGGAMWNNSMDGIYTYYRPYEVNDNGEMIQSGIAQFHNLKQRKPQIVAHTGMVDNIEFRYKTNRFYFNGRCPITG